MWDFSIAAHVISLASLNIFEKYLDKYTGDGKRSILIVKQLELSDTVGQLQC